MSDEALDTAECNREAHTEVERLKAQLPSVAVYRPQTTMGESADMKTSTLMAVAWSFGAFQAFAVRALYGPDGANRELTLWIGITAVGVAVVAGLVSVFTRK